MMMTPPDPPMTRFREPVLTWGVLPTGITVMIAAAQMLGLIPKLGEHQVGTVVQAALFLVMIVGWGIARAKVTPVASPRDGDAVALVRSDGKLLNADRNDHMIGDF